MQTDILLVNPPITLEERYGAFASVGSQAPPLGLCYLAAILKHKGYSVTILDAPAYDLTLEQTLQKIDDVATGIIGITATTASIIRAAELAQALKEKGSTARLVIGGPHVSALPERTLQEFSAFDIGVINEGEYTIVDLVRSLTGDGDMSRVQGIVYRDNGTLHITEPRPLIENLDDLPFPAWDMLPYLPKYYKPAPHSYYQLPSATLMTSRGCNGTCTFCARPFMGERYRSNSPEYTLGMIDYLVTHYGIRDIMFYDDNFLLDRKRVVSICEGILKRGYKITWSCLARTDVMPEDFFRLIRKAGCWQIAYGIESGDQTILNNIKKRTTIERMTEMIRKANEAGIHTRGYFMIGCPGETKDSISRTMHFMTQSGLKDFHVTFCTPMPGAELFTTASQYGTFECDWRKLGFWEPVFIPFGMTKEELIASHRRMFRKFYLRPRVIVRYLIKIMTKPTIALNIIKAGLDVIRYSMAGYFQSKARRIKPAHHTTG
ncbi:MAG: B12-binding domain-containing radical SAM protein [Desulfobacterota bacterium]|nr:B12-binding domain-containing radical SAM protein [Thermodesulfobacteriota bacterium]